jgi:hypothetical protein
MTVTYPVVSAAQNGSAVADVETTFYDVYGRPVWYKDGDGFLNYTAYDTATGAVTPTECSVDRRRHRRPGWAGYLAGVHVCL